MKYTIELEHKWPNDAIQWCACTKKDDTYICKSGATAEEAEKSLIEALKAARQPTITKEIEI